MSSWGWLAIAILAEVAGTVCMKLSEGLTRPLPTVLIILFYGISFALLAQALRVLPVAVCYAIWSAAGIVLITLVSVVLFDEAFGIAKACSMLLVIAGIAGLTLGR